MSRNWIAPLAAVAIGAAGLTTTSTPAEARRGGGLVAGLIAGAVIGGLVHREYRRKRHYDSYYSYGYRPRYYGYDYGYSYRPSYYAPRYYRHW